MVRIGERMTYYCPVCRTPLIRIAEYTYYCVDCQKKVGALVNRKDGDEE